MASVCSLPRTPLVSSACATSSAAAAEGRPAGGRGRLELTLRAGGYVAVPHAAIDPWRRKPPAVSGVTLSPGFLRPVDEQTVCVYLAVAQAICDAGLDGAQFKEWGVLAAPRFLGRVFDGGTFQKFLQIGGGAVSVHLIPQQSQHAVSGAISVAFAMQGPNFGIAGGPRSLPEALLTAFTAYDPSVVPGLWLLLSEFDPEAVPDHLGKHTTPAVCHALALALSLEPGAGPRLALEWSFDDAPPHPTLPVSMPIAALAGPLMTAARGAVRGPTNWDLGGGFRLELSAAPADGQRGGT